MRSAGAVSSRSSSRQIQAGPAIHLPIFDAGALRSQLKGRYADFDLDVANYNQTLINALNDVATQVVVDPFDRPADRATQQRALDAVDARPTSSP